MVGMRERLGGRLPPRTRFDEPRVWRRSRGDEVDIDGPVAPPIAVDNQLDMTNKLLIRPCHPETAVHPLCSGSRDLECIAVTKVQSGHYLNRESALRRGICRTLPQHFSIPNEVEAIESRR